MRAWLQPLEAMLARGEAAVLVHLVELKGSAPREVGAQMLVGEHELLGTVGGGAFEQASVQVARVLLEGGRAAVERYALGPDLNQCCGGSVTLALEPFAPADLAWLRKLIQAADGPAPVTRTLTIDASGPYRRDWSSGDGDGADYSARLGLSGAEGLSVTIRERINPQPQPLWLFGAGHVGRAVAQAVHPLGFALTWIDGRAAQFPGPPLAGVRELALAMPELIVDEAPPGAIFLVMTHSHPLDETICDAILRRGDFAHLGLIGSASKRARFVRRLGEAGIPAADLARLVCPIGLAQIASKEPAAIAAGVAADLLIRREAGAFARTFERAHDR